MFISLDGKMHMPQSEILVDINVSTAGSNAALAAAAVPGLGVLLAAGAAGAAVDAKVNAERQKSAEKAIEPIRNQLVGYDFANVVHGKVSAELKKIDWLNVTNIELDRETSVLPENVEANFANSTASAYMSVNLDYAITADLKHVEMDALAQIFPKTTDLEAYKHTPKQKKKSLEKNTEILDTVFYRTFKVRVPLPEMEDMGEAKRDAVKEKLGALEKDGLVIALEQAADQLATNIAAAISNPDLEEG